MPVFRAARARPRRYGYDALTSFFKLARSAFEIIFPSTFFCASLKMGFRPRRKDFLACLDEGRREDGRVCGPGLVMRANSR